MFTLETVLTVAREVVAEKGEDYVYPRSEKKSRNPVTSRIDEVCQYAYEGRPSCLVGHVIYRLDPDAFSSVMESEAKYGPAAAAELVLEGILPEDFWDAEAENAMQEAQVAQDKGATWGRALDTAERAVI